MAFENDDIEAEVLADYYESQDCSYQVAYKQIATIPDHMIPELIMVITRYFTRPATLNGIDVESYPELARESRRGDQ